MKGRSVHFIVLGAAQTKGSAKAFVPKKWADESYRQGKAPRAIVTNDNPNAKAWQQRIATEAQAVAGDGLFIGPVALEVTFHLPRPKSMPKRVVHHMTRPDVDKAARCVLDALTDVLYNDDGQIVQLTVRKFYAALGEAPRVDITVADAVATVQVVAEPQALFG